MHPYEMQRLIREWHKDEFLDLKRGSLYHSIDRLRKAGWIDPCETSREGRRPERTVYRLTEAGEEEVMGWLRELLAKPLPEPTPFFAALSFLPHLTPQVVREQLEERTGRLTELIASLDMVLKTMVPRVGRLVLIEVEYVQTMRKAELKWVRSLLAELESGAFTWDPEIIRRFAAQVPVVESAPQDLCE